MGSFSWLKADVTTNQANISYGDRFACLIPKEFGGGYIVDNYRDYGHLYDEKNNVEYDMYELLAFWNKDITSDKLKYDGEFPDLKPIDKYTNNNRNLGIDIGCYDIDIDSIKYPLKLVSVKYAKTHTYEDCPNKSFGDPYQGAGELTWKRLINEKSRFTMSPNICVGFYKLLQDRLSFIENNYKKFEEVNLIRKVLSNCELVDNELNKLISNVEDIKEEIEFTNNPEQLEILEEMLNEADKKVEDKQKEINAIKISFNDDINKMDEIERD